MQIGRQTEAGKIMVLGWHEMRKSPIICRTNKQLVLHRQPHHLMLQNYCLL